MHTVACDQSNCALSSLIPTAVKLRLPQEGREQRQPHPASPAQLVQQEQQAALELVDPQANT